ncbi:hypothetical protein Pmani_036234 [Petrolisthes manimaculis]|uniref:Uncharacterized protein n=1 Tax=Petrolisthes manimaculis TaxID=1843537 RepID=A0AAE1NKQ0_9EUCA|nr:hypothetical protein Pmani_036234 [Petrolisthes manimaculis]
MEDRDKTLDGSVGGGGEGPASGIINIGEATGVGVSEGVEGGGTEEYDDDDDDDDDGGGGRDCGGGSSSGEDDGCHSGGEEDVGTITPLARLLRCAHSDNYFDRYAT